MLKLKKSLGQNLLIDNNIIKKIINLQNLSNQNVFEIGPGSGNLTNLICKEKPKSLFLVEKDKRFYENLKRNYSKIKNFKIINKDILDYNLNNYEDSEVIVLGNLPYNISTKILSNFVKINSWPPFYKSIIFMFQNEVADRILAKPNTSKFGRITILVNLKLDVVTHFKISKKCFFPTPKIDSKIIVFKPKKKVDFSINKIENLEKITHAFFSNRRKMINKTFKKLKINSDNILKNQNIDLTLRPENLSEILYYKITEYYEKRTK